MRKNIRIVAILAVGVVLVGTVVHVALDHWRHGPFYHPPQVVGLVEDAVVRYYRRYGEYPDHLQNVIPIWEERWGTDTLRVTRQGDDMYLVEGWCNNEWQRAKFRRYYSEQHKIYTFAFTVD